MKTGKEKTTMLAVKVSVRDQVKIAAAVSRLKLNEFVEKALIAEAKKVLRVK